jgi:hypothetical protein
MSGWDDVVGFGGDFRTGNPTKAMVQERIRVLKEVQHKSGFEYPAGVVFDTGAGVIDLTKVSIDNMTRKNIDTIGMLATYADVMGVQFPKEIKNALQGLDKSFVWDFADKQISQWVGTGSELMSSAMSKVSSTPLGNGAFELGMTTIGAVSDGFVSDQEIRSIATTAGGVIGGAIGSIIPGIGTAIGALVGSTIGSLIGEVVTWFTEPRWDKVMAEMQKEAKKARDRIRGECSNAEAEFVLYVEQNIYRLSDMWHNAENTFGFRIPLRWFDANPGLPFVYKAFETSNANRYPLLPMIKGAKDFHNPIPEKYTSDYRYGKFECRDYYMPREGALGPAGGKDWRTVGQQRVGTCNFFCPNTLLGCLYPEPPESAFGPSRVAAAFEARGFSLPPNFGCEDISNAAAGVDCKKKYKDVKGSDAEKEEMCKKYIRGLIMAQAKGVEENINKQQKVFQTVANIISKDLTRTIALMKSQNDIFANRVALSQPSIITSPSITFAAAQVEHVNRMRNIALVGGAGVLGLAAWKVLR